MEKIVSALESIWLNEKEVKIYLASLSIGQASASVLWQKTGIARSSSQYTCNSLVEKRLLNAISQWNGFIYSPEAPAKIMLMANKELSEVQRKVISIEKVMSDLNTLANPNAKMPKIKYYSGVDGIKDLFLDIIWDKNIVKWYIYLWQKSNQELLDFLENEYVPQRKALGIPAYAICNSTENWPDWLKGSKETNRNIQIIEREQYPIDTCVQIYGDKVSFCSLIDGDLTGIIIENRNIARTHLSCFEMLFKTSGSL